MKLISIVYAIVSAVLVSVFVMAILLLGYEEMSAVLWAVIAAWGVSLPISIIITRRIIAFGKINQPK
jgi:hypothetical protein